jgi:hypothetical protein
MSLATKPLTSSLNVNVAVNALLVIAPDMSELITTVGDVASKVVVNWLAAVLLFPALSCATPDATSIATTPSLTGVSVAEYSEALVEAKLLTVALLAVISVNVKPVTFSLKVKVAVNALLVREPAFSEVIATAGEVAS